MKKRIFITGIPASGKSYLAKKLADHVGGIVVSTDDLREEMHNDLRYKKWVNFYLDQDEKTYYTTTSPERQWSHLVAQSEGMWPFILEKIRLYDDEAKSVIFEGVNILPHLAKRDLEFPGIVIIGKSRKEIFDRIKADHRWGNTEELWNLEADSFFNIERPQYKKEAEKYGYLVFETSDDAFKGCLKEMNKDNLINKLKQEGFTHVYYWSDKPTVEYPEHVHKGKVSFYITKGSVTFSGDIKTTINAGERFDVPVGVKHSAVVGLEGCDWVVGEEIEGDS